MNIYEKIEAIEKSIISLAGDKTTDGKPNGKNYISLEKMEKKLSPLFQKYKLFLKKEVTKSNSSCSTYEQKTEKYGTQTKVMYFVDVEATFTFIDISSGESLDFKFCGSDNKNTNAGQCYSSAVSYARRNFYKTIFNIEIGTKDNILEELEDKKDIVSETVDEDSKQMSKVYCKTLVNALKDKYGEQGYILQINKIKAKHKLEKLEKLLLADFKQIVKTNFDIDEYIKVS